MRLSRWRVIGNNGSVITTGYTDLNAGTLTVTDVTGWSQPVTFEHRIEDMAMIGDDTDQRQDRLHAPITHDYPGAGLVFVDCTGHGRSARTSVDQLRPADVEQHWTDARSGSAATSTFNTTNNPIVVTNSGALTERWAIQFINNVAFSVIGEHVNVIAIATPARIARRQIRPVAPYFTIRRGLGSGLTAEQRVPFSTRLVPITPCGWCAASSKAETVSTIRSPC